MAMAAMLPFVGIATSCRDAREDNSHVMARQLFTKSVNVIRIYTDSIRNVSDSASFKRMTEGFEESIVKVNFQFPPDTDLKMTEAENDSLINLLDSLASAVRMKEKTLGKIYLPDSLRADTVRYPNPGFNNSRKPKSIVVSVPADTTAAVTP